MAIAALGRTRRFWVSIYGQEGREASPITNGYPIQAKDCAQAFVMGCQLVPNLKRHLVVIEEKGPLGRQIVHQGWVELPG